MAEPANTQANGNIAEKEPSTNGVRGYFARHPRAKWGVLAILLILVIASFGVWRYFTVRETTDDAQIDAHINPISARISGTVVAVKVENNEYVKAGTVLVEIDPTDYQVAIERAQADYAEAQAAAQAAGINVPMTTTTTGSQLSSADAGLEQAQAGVNAAQTEVSAAKSQLAAAQARLKEDRAKDTRAARDLERMKLLISKDEISQQQYDASVADADSFRAVVAADQARVSAAEQAISVAESHVLQARASLAQAKATVRSANTAPQQISIKRSQAASAEAKVLAAKAALDQAQLNLQYATVKAPVDGVVSKRSVEIGQNVQLGQPLLALVQLDDVWVTANYKETAVRKMRPGQPATIHVDTFGRDYKGHVLSIAGATGEKFSLLPPENATGNYVKVVQRVPVKILFEKGQDPDHLLRPGMSVEPTVITK